MKLSIPKNNNIDWDKLPGIPDRLGNHSGAYLIAAVEDGSSFYVCLTNEERDQVWIEKISSFQAVGQFHFEQLIRIEDDQEWTAIHNFLIQKGILDER